MDGPTELERMVQMQTRVIDALPYLTWSGCPIGQALMMADGLRLRPLASLGASAQATQAPTHPDYLRRTVSRGIMGGDASGNR